MDQGRLEGDVMGLLWMIHLKQHNENVGDGYTDTDHEHDVVADEDLGGGGTRRGDSRG